MENNISTKVGKILFNKKNLIKISLLFVLVISIIFISHSVSAFGQLQLGNEVDPIYSSENSTISRSGVSVCPSNYVLMNIISNSSGVFGDCVNSSEFNINNSEYLQGYTPTTLKNWIQGLLNSIFAPITEPLSLHLNGDNSPTATIDWDGQDLINVSNLKTTSLTVGTAKITNLIANGVNISNLSNEYVPYTGANANVDLGIYDITTTGEATADRVNTDDYAVASDDFSYLASALLSGDARRGMLPLMMDLYSDALAFRGISALEYYDYGTTAWVAWGGETGQELLDGNSNTYFEADYTHRKWRITIHTNTYLMAGMVFCERSWDGNGAAGSGANGFDLIVETDTIAAFTSPTEKGTATYTTNTGTSVNSMLLINAHVNEAYWRFTFDGSATMDHADDVMLFHNLKMLTSANLNRGTFRGNPWATSYDKAVTFEGAITTTEKGTFGSLDVDTLNFNGNVISDSTGTISFDDEDITTTGDVSGATLTAGNGFTGSCVNVTYSGGIAISCND